MRKYLIIFLLLMTSVSVHGAEWVLVWSDEFDYTGLPDSSKWNYEEGFVRNREVQYYTRERKENARVENGVLIIEARKEHFKNPKLQTFGPEYGDDTIAMNSELEFAEYTSASLTTLNKKSFTFGRIEVRAKLPEGKGTHPGIWTLGTNIRSIGWPRCGEIDILEFLGKRPEYIHNTTHYYLDGNHRSNANTVQVDKPYNDFHLYAIEWSPDRIDFFFDQKKTKTFYISNAGKGEENPFRKAHYLLIDFALGSKWAGEIDEAIMPQKFLIDYVRIYEKK